MSDLEDLTAKAARLWLEFMQAQAKAAAAAAKKLPEMTRSLAETGVPLAAEVNRWIESTLPAGPVLKEAQAEPPGEGQQIPRPSSAPSPRPDQTPRPVPLMRSNHRPLKIRKSLARRRMRRA